LPKIHNNMLKFSQKPIFI
ncbi:hypothetical protein BV129_00842B, partial [Haemophilus influenzae]